MMKEFKNMQNGSNQTREEELWCIDCKAEGHTKGSCPKKQFCDICQIVGHSTKECPFDIKTKGHQLLLTQETSIVTGARMNTNNDVTSGGYCNNNQHEQGGNNNNNNNNGGRN